MKAKKKMISTSALWSEKLAGVGHAEERLFWRVYMASDNYGVMSGKPWDVMHQAVPGVDGYTRGSVGQALDSLTLVELLERWTEADQSVWIHVVEHDRHQAPDYLRKRGMRRSPIPPSGRREKVALRADNSREGQPSAPHAEGCPSHENSAPTVSVSVSGSVSKGSTTTTDNVSPPVPLNAVASTSSWSQKTDDEQYDERQARPATPLTEIKAAQDRIAAQLSKMLVSTDDANTMAMMIATTKRRQALGRPPKVYDISVWERAVRVMVRMVTEEGKRLTGDPMGLLVSLLPSYELEGSDRQVQIRELAPKTERKVETAEEIFARFEREAAEREGVAS